MKRPILFEDATSYYNKWVQGIASRELGSQKIGLKDILKQNEEHLDQNPNFAKAGNEMPYPIPNAVSILGDVIVYTSNSLNLFRQSLKNPALKDKKARGQVILIVNTLSRCITLINLLLKKLSA